MVRSVPTLKRESPKPSFFNNAARLAGLALLLTVPSLASTLSATATYTGTADPVTAGVYDYSLTFNNTGTTNIGTFWFAWVPGGDFLAPKPISNSSPAGWTNGQFNNATNTGTSIRWVTTTSPLLPGQSLSGLNFTSLETPHQLLGNVLTGTGAGGPILTSFVYIGAPFGDPGLSFVPVAQTPEPDSLFLMATGLLSGAGACYRRMRSSKSV